MITSLANNFGYGPIQIKDYQDENMIILNTKLIINPASEAYKAAEVLEITVPDLSIPQSAVTGCYIGSQKIMNPGLYYEKLYRFGTLLKTWIKDKNTICIEKFAPYNDLEEITIWLCSMYAIAGKRGEVRLYDSTPVNCDALEPNFYPDDEIMVVEPNWCFLHFVASGSMQLEDEVPVQAVLEGVPTDIDIEFPLMGGGQQADCPGVCWSNCTLKNGQITIETPRGTMGNTSADPFVMIYAVRG